MDAIEEKYESLKTHIYNMSSAKTNEERRSHIEISLAEIEGRAPEEWATKYMEYVESKSNLYF